MAYFRALKLSCDVHMSRRNIFIYADPYSLSSNQIETSSGETHGNLPLNKP